MADLSYFHGSRVSESPDTPSLVRISNHNTTFYNGTSADADPAAFPVNQPTMVTGASALSALGNGWLAQQVARHFGEGGSAVIVNRVVAGANAQATEANIIGDMAQRTGIYAALRCKGLLGVRPAVLVTEGDTGAIIEGGAIGAVLATAGSNLTEAPTVTASGGGTAAGKVLPVIEAVLGEGAAAGTVVALRIVNPGRLMSAAPTLAFAGGGSHGSKVLPTGTVNIGDVGNPIVTALQIVAPMVRARAYVDGPNTTNAAAVRFRKTLSGGRILPIDPRGLINDGGVPVAVPAAPVFAGIRSRVVMSPDGVSGSVSNKPIRTLAGSARTIVYPEDSNYLNENHVATIINENGLRTWGSRLATSDLIWAFDSVRATADMINDSLEQIYFEWVDRKFTAGNLKGMIEDGMAALRAFRDAEHILGGKVWLGDLNTPTLNAQGKVFLNVEFEPVGLMEQISITTHRNIAYYQLLLDQVRGAIDNGPLTVS
ncbi:phage tail sheath protein [Pannonibacter tanglangensis]|uniref:Phage tail protein n=1 Tax=Pannonibacter tanglangensis TaxID=2750084 RepID=A0ABW9ZIB4_9HYPH|nr:phage tail protein [Pannonibacter sp. XCT-34]NBN62777.1 phage tail protein [Pannonibacter sp. XCT-34]